MQEKEEEGEIERRTKEMMEHFYRAGVDTFAALRSLVPSLPAGSRTTRLMRNAQKEMLLGVRTFIDSELAFIEKVETSKTPKSAVKKIQIKQK